MKYNQSIRHALYSTTILFGVLAFAPATFAQESDLSPAEPASEEIVVTGSLITNPNLQQSSPVKALTRDEISLQQPVSAEQIIRELPGSTPNIGASVNNGANGSANVDLRGLGPNRNLVLLDGQRIVPDGVAAITDVNNIPPALIERVDITTGGGSSVYGADAVAGVVNFITRKNFSGMEATVSSGIAEEGDGATFNTNLTLGANFDDGRGNAVISLGYTQTDAVFQGDRSFSVFGLSSASGNRQGSGTTTPTNFIFPISGQVDPVTGMLTSTVKTFNFNPFNMFQTPFERYNIYSQANYELSDTIEVFGKGIFSHNEITAIVAPSGTFFNTYNLPLSNPFLPAGIRNAFCADPDVALTPAQCSAAATAVTTTDPNYREIAITPGRRFVEGGSRIGNFTTDLFQIMGGARGPLLSNLDWEIRGQYGESSRIATASGSGLNSRVQQALLATNPNSCLNSTNACVPLNLFGAEGSITQGMLDFLDPTPTSVRVRTSLAAFNASVSGDFGVASPWAENPIGIAAGFEYRKYAAAIIPDLPSQTDSEVLGAGGAVQPVDGGFDVKDFFGEIIAPIVEDKPFIHSLTIEAGIRYSDYSTSGGSTAWKAGGSWEPVEGLKFRGVYQRAVRAANIGELFTPVSIGLANSDVDPCQGAAPVGNASLRAACIASGAPASQIGNIAAPSAGQINITFGGNPNLKPEKAKTLTFGAVLQPAFLPGFSASLDYFKIKLSDAITAPNVDDILDGCYVQFDLAVCSTIGRNPLNGSFNGGGETRGLPLFLSNTGKIKTSGLDLSLNYETDLGFAELNVGFTGNYMFEQKFQATPASIDRECNGYYSVNCGLSGSLQPKISWNQRTTLSFDEINVSYLWRHIGENKAEPLIAANFLERFRRISAKDYFDLAIRVKPSEKMSFTVTVANLLDQKPPIVGSTIGSTLFNSGNTYPSTYDAIGRRYTVGAKLTF